MTFRNASQLNRGLTLGFIMEINEDSARADGEYLNDSDDHLIANTIKHANLQLEQLLGFPETLNQN